MADFFFIIKYILTPAATKCLIFPLSKTKKDAPLLQEKKVLVLILTELL